MRSDPGPAGLISPIPLIPSNAAVVSTLVEDIAAFFDDGSSALQRLVARIPLFFEVDRAYIARISPDGVRFTVTQATTGEWGDLLGYTQSVARLPAYVRGSLKSGVQGSISDCPLFPFTPQQRRMLWFQGIGATVVTPIPSAGKLIGALVVDVFKGPRQWELTTLDALKSLAEAVGARFALARLGDHLSTDERDPVNDTARLNLLANIAQLLERSNDPAATSSAIAVALDNLPFVASAKFSKLENISKAGREALASEHLMVRSDGSDTKVVLPIVCDGERFGAIELTLSTPRLAAPDEQFLRTAGVFASNAFASAVRRARPREAALLDILTGLLNYRSINEVLVESVHAAKSGNRNLSACLFDIEGLDEINRLHGYAVGDDVVSYVGHALGSAIGDRGTAGRVGGGNFLAIFPGQTSDDATVGAQMFVERVARQGPSHLPPIGLTSGVAAFPLNAHGHDDLLRAARLALYAAKAAGKNKTVAAQANDATWMRMARDAFVKIVSGQQLPIEPTPRPK